MGGQNVQGSKMFWLKEFLLNIENQALQMEKDEHKQCWSKNYRPELVCSITKKQKSARLKCNIFV